MQGEGHRWNQRQHSWGRQRSTFSCATSPGTNDGGVNETSPTSTKSSPITSAEMSITAGWKRVNSSTMVFVGGSGWDSFSQGVVKNSSLSMAATKSTASIPPLGKCVEPRQSCIVWRPGNLRGKMIDAVANLSNVLFDVANKAL